MLRSLLVYFMDFNCIAAKPISKVSHITLCVREQLWNQANLSYFWHFHKLAARKLKLSVPQVLNYACFQEMPIFSLPENFNSFLQEHSLLTTQILAKLFSYFFPRTHSNIDFFSSLSTLIIFYFIILFIFFRYIWMPLVRMMKHFIISKYVINLSVVFFSDPTTQFSY